MCMYLRSSLHPNGSLCNECHTEIWNLFWQHERASGIILRSMKEIWGSFWQHGNASGVILGIMTKIWKPFWQHERASEVILGSTREIWEAFWAAWESLSGNFGLHEREHKWLHESSHATQNRLHESSHATTYALSCNPKLPDRLSHAAQNAFQIFLMLPKMTPEALSCRQNGSQIFFLLPEMIPEAFT